VCIATLSQHRCLIKVFVPLVKRKEYLAAHINFTRGNAMIAASIMSMLPCHQVVGMTITRVDI
jgi:hypothetical protein